MVYLIFMTTTKKLSRAQRQSLTEMIQLEASPAIVGWHKETLRVLIELGYAVEAPVQPMTNFGKKYIATAAGRAAV